MSALRDAMSHAALGWVKPELDETLRQARNEIEFFVEEPSDTSRMRFCAGYLHQVQGTLRMVELYAPAMVAEELELLANAVQAGQVGDRDEACAMLMRGTVLLPDYLERLQNGHRDIPIVLLPLLNEIRSIRGEPGLSESVLFAFDPQAGNATEAELDHARGSLAGRNRELLDTVGNAVKEELLRVKDALDLHLRTGGDVAELQGQVNELGSVADTLGMMGLGVARNVVVQQRDALRRIVDGQQQVDESLLLDIAGALLYVDASLDDQVASLGSDGGSDDASASAAASEVRRTVEVLAQEAIANFGAAREHFVAFIETNWDHARLADVPHLLDEVGGAMRILDLPQPADYLEGVRRYVQYELIDRGRVPSGRQLDTLADAMASLEYYLEALRERRPGREEILDITRNSLETLRYWPLPDAPVPVPEFAVPLTAAAAVPVAALALAEGDADAGDSVPDAPTREPLEMPAPTLDSRALDGLGRDIAGIGTPVAPVLETPAWTFDPLPERVAAPVADTAPTSPVDAPLAFDPVAAEQDALDVSGTAFDIAPVDLSGDGGQAPGNWSASFTIDAGGGAFDPVSAEQEAAPAEADAVSYTFDASALEGAELDAAGPASPFSDITAFEAEPVIAEPLDAGAVAEPVVADAQAQAFEIEDIVAAAAPDADASAGAAFDSAELVAAVVDADAAEADAPVAFDAAELVAEVAEVADVTEPPALPPLPPLDLPAQAAPDAAAVTAALSLDDGTFVDSAAPEHEADNPFVESAALTPAAEEAFDAPAAANVHEAVIGEIELDAASAAFMAELDAAAAGFAAEADDAPAEPVAAVPAAVVGLPGGFEDDGNEIDSDIREVFLEEFDEELVNLGQLLPVWRAAPASVENLRPIRRVFHTLKGSGRLVGAKTLGEFSWKIEGMLNRVLDGSRAASPAVVAMVEQAYEVLPQLNAALRDGSPIRADLLAMQAVADAVGAGEETFYVASAAPVAAPAAAAPVVSGAIAPDEGTPASVDSVLREILEAEVSTHLDTVHAWLHGAPQPVSEALLRAVHTMSGAFAMTDVPEITSVTSPAESYVKRALAAGATPSQDGVDGIAATAAAIATTIAALQAESPRIPSFAPLAARLRELVASLPEAPWPVQSLGDELDAESEAVVAEAPAELTGVEDLAPYLDASLPSGPVYGQIDHVDAEASSEAASFTDTTTSDIGFDPSAGNVEDALVAADIEPQPLAVSAQDALAADAGVETVNTDADVEALATVDVDIDVVPASPALPTELDAAAPAVVDVDEDHANTAEAALPVAADAQAFDAPTLDGLALSDEDDDDTDADALVLEDLSDAELLEATGTDAIVEAADADAFGALTLAPLAEQDEAEIGDVDAALPSGSGDADLATPGPIELPAEDDAGIDIDADAELLAAVAALPSAVPEDDAVSVLGAGTVDALDAAAGLAETTPVEAGTDALAGFDVVELTEAAEEAVAAADYEEVADLDAPGLSAPVVEADAVEAVVVAPAEPDANDAGALDFEELDEELVDIFVEEGKDLLDHCDGLIAGLRETPDDRDILIGLQRDLHTLKGGARMAGINALGDLGHGIESLLEAVAAHRTELARDDVQLLERGFDRLHRLLVLTGKHRAVVMPADLIEAFDARAHGRTEVAVAADAAPVVAARSKPASELVAPAPLSAPVPLEAQGDEEFLPRPQQEQVRVRADLLDRLVNHAGEVAIYRSRLEQQLGAFRGAMGELDRTNARLRDQLRRLDLETEAQIVARYQREQDQGDQTFDPLELDRFSTLQQLSRALNESAADLGGLQGVLDDLARQYDGLLQQQSRVSSELQDGLMRARMVPFDGLVPRLRRVVRQAGAETGKQVHLQLDGTHGELDRNVLDRMVAPLEHMLRNSVAHGLETPEQRRAAGKAEEGRISLRLRREGSEIVLEVSDDGAGLDREAIRRRGEQRGLIAEGEVLSESELDNLIFASGFSTSEQVSQLAGRGVGMDVVRNEVRQLGGSVDIHSVRGQGVTFTLRLPQTLAVTQAVFVRIGETTFAVPVASVSGIGRIARGRYESGEGGYHYAGEEYTLHDLGSLVGQAAATADGAAQVPLLLVRAGDLRAAVAIDQVLGNREIVVKPVGLQIASVPGIYGATITGDGRVVVILDVAPLVRRHLTQPAKPVAEVAAESQRHVPVVMVVDDSLTMRKVTGRVLERHNFEVVVARDGVEALERLEERVPDLMLLDIEMPRMDGYELATAMRADPRYKDVPIVMITSRSGEKHRQRAFEIGVQRYLGKPYQELDLMRNVYDLLGIARVRE